MPDEFRSDWEDNQPKKRTHAAQVFFLLPLLRASRRSLSGLTGLRAAAVEWRWPSARRKPRRPRSTHMQASRVEVAAASEVTSTTAPPSRRQRRQLASSATRKSPVQAP